MNESAQGHGGVLTNLAGATARIDQHPKQEWLVTNGIGGYASGTVLGPITRRYHGLLIAALPNPLGRFMMLHALFEYFFLPGGGMVFAGPPDFLDNSAAANLTPTEFRLELGLPVWIYDVGGSRIEKRLVMPYKQNTVHLEYRCLGGSGGIRMGLRAGIQLRNHDAFVDTETGTPYALSATDCRLEVSGGPDLPVLRLKTTPKTGFTYEPKTAALDYPVEQSRGYPSRGTLWSPGYFQADLRFGSALILTASTEPWDIVEALPFEEALSSERSRLTALVQKAPPHIAGGIVPQLVLAADQFLITPVGRTEDAARAQAAGDEPLTVIAGYHWFTDWGRDTMISLEGLTLVVGRHQEARWILRTFAHYVRDGLIPNMFPEGEKQGLYHTADASLWYFHAVSRYLDATGDRITLQAILPQLHEIVNSHIAGTHFGIHVNPEDGLLVQGEEGYQLTWMDAKVGDWVVTPRRGKAVEINALWYNALCLLSNWTGEEGDLHLASVYRQHADRARTSFNRRFWNGGWSICLMLSMASPVGGRRETTPPAAPINCWRFRSKIRCLMKSIGRLWWMPPRNFS